MGRTTLFALVFAASALSGSGAALAEDDLTTLFQREHAFLVAQKESLRRAGEDARRSHAARMKKMEGELKAMEAETAKLAVRNDEAFETVQRLEKERKEAASRGSALRSLYKKAAGELRRLESELRFELPAEDDPPPPERIGIADFEPLGSRAIAALRAAGETVETKAHYRGADGRLFEGSVLRFGAVGAQAVGEGRPPRVLGPSEEGVLTEIEGAAGGGGRLTGIYAFERLNDRAIALRAPALVDQLASFAPGVLLLGLFGLVGGLFAALLRE